MRLPQDILNIILSNKTSLGENPAIPSSTDGGFLASLVDVYYDELSSHWSQIDIQEMGNTLSMAIEDCKKLESQSKQSLEQLCVETVNELFHIPNDTVKIDVELVDKIDTKQQRLIPEDTTDFSFDSLEDMSYLTSEIYKRRFLNALIIGAAMYYTENVKSYSERLAHINEELLEYYHYITVLNNLLIFHTKHDLGINSKQGDGGVVNVYMSSPDMPVTIEAKGVIFPTLLQETIKGVLELAIAHGLPKSLEKAKYITSKADFKLAELWDQRLGLPLWKYFLDEMGNIGKDPLEVGLNFIFMELSKLKPDHFNAVMREILKNSEAGCQVLSAITDNIEYNKDQDDFDDYMQQRQAGDYQYPLDDDGEEFTSDELLNDDLCSTLVLDETEL